MDINTQHNISKETPVDHTPLLLDPRFLDAFVSNPVSMQGLSWDVVERINLKETERRQPSFKYKADDGFKAFSWAIDEEGYRVSPEEFFKTLPPYSIATIPVNGAMQMNDIVGFWSGRTLAAGTLTIGKWVELLDANPNVIAIKFDINSPGGEALGNETLNNLIKSCSTLTAAHATLMASAAYYSYCGCDIVAAKEKISIIGSIGVMMTMARETGEGWLANSGYEFKEVYSSYSTEKNASQREFQEEGTTEKAVAFLDAIALPFINTVKGNRKIKDDKSVFKGKIYTASEAVKIGLIDGIESSASLDEKLMKMALSKDNNAGNLSGTSIHQAQTTTMAEKNKETATSEEVQEPTPNDLQAQIDELKGGLTGLIGVGTANESIKKANAINASLQKEKEELTTTNTELAASVQMLQTALQTAQATAEDFKGTIETLKGQLADASASAEGKEAELEVSKKTIEEQDAHAKQLAAEAIESKNTPTKVDTEDITNDPPVTHKATTTTDLIAKSNEEVEAMLRKKGE